jgi:hypothetical protein
MVGYERHIDKVDRGGQYNSNKQTGEAADLTASANAQSELCVVRIR